ncbi:sigma-70 family RNA polymerase sigma factor [Aestuariimicrobium soli]|uniref:sigma-70 family RNA polymerase sigma factor n=1 Tax=Aestuariimicrobium soli TaxID=2035834 RepID=UPI003EB7F444
MTNTTAQRVLLSADQEIQLARAIEAGVVARAALAGDFDCSATADELAAVMAAGERAWLTMWEANLGLVEVLAKRAARRYGLPVDDLTSEAQLGLAEAIMRWDHTRGTRFSTLGWIWITNRLQTAQRELFRGRDELRAGLRDDDLVLEDDVDARIGEDEQPLWLERVPRPERLVLELLARPDLSPTQVQEHLGLTRSGFYRLRIRALRLGEQAWRRTA